MDGRRIRPLFLPPHPRRNRYTPVVRRNSLPSVSAVSVSTAKTPDPLLPSSSQNRTPFAGLRFCKERWVLRKLAPFRFPGFRKCCALCLRIPGNECYPRFRVRRATVRVAPSYRLSCSFLPSARCMHLAPPPGKAGSCFPFGGSGRRPIGGKSGSGDRKGRPYSVAAAYLREGQAPPLQFCFRPSPARGNPRRRSPR